MIEKKSLINTIKRALQTGSFQMIGQELKMFPIEVCRIDTLNFEDQNWWDCNPITKMDLSNNNIQDIPAEIAKLPDLQLIRLKNNEVRELPLAVFELVGLKSLDLAKNKVSSLPLDIQRAGSLVQLILSGNELVNLPDVIQHLSNLEILMVDSNKLERLPTLPPNLKRLDASINHLTSLSRQQTRLVRQLEYINLNKNHIVDVEPGTFSQCRNLVTLEIKQNKLVSFTQLPKSEKLDTIIASFNRIRQFEQFENCPNLSVLILSDNKIDKLSSGIIWLKKLKTLDVSNNDLSDLPSELGLLPGLVRIQLEGNPLKCIRQNLRTAGAQQLKKYLKERMDTKELEKVEKKVIDPRHQMNSGLSHWQKLIMDFSTGNELAIRGQNLQELDPIIYKPTIRILNLSQNKLTTIHPQIVKMSQLQILILNDNLIERLPQELLKISTLEQFEIKKNKLQNFFTSKSVCGWDRLYMLDLSVNRIAKFPPVIVKIPKLRILHLSYNKLETIDELFAKDCLWSLQIIDASNNHISQLSQQVGNRHASLNFLNVENNNISKLPTVLGFMKLTGLKVDGNPLKLIKRSVIDKGTVALLDDLRNKHLGPQPIFQSIEKPLPPPKQSNNQEKMECEEEQPRQISSSKLSDRERQQFQRRIGLIGQQIARIEQEVENNLSMNKLQKAEKKRLVQSLLIERNKLQQMLQ